MAPEQAAGRSDTDGRVDIYALGVILYEMITGRVPHRGESMVRTLAMQMLDPIDPPRKARPDLDISIELEEVVMRALAKKREQRFQSMTDFLNALDKLQTPVGVSITGSPVYALTPLPPGADPSLALPQTAPSMVPPKLKPKRSPAEAPPAPNNVADTMRETPRSRPITSRIKDEPQFVTDREKPITFEHVFTDAGASPDRRLWPYVLLFVLILAGAAGAIVFVVKSRSRANEPTMRDAGVVAVGDAAPIADAVVAIPVGTDAAIDALDIVVLVDAGHVAVRPAKDAGGAATVVTPNGRGTISIQVITKPEGATLYEGTSYRGPGGTNLEMPFGSKVEITCKHAGYKNGTVQLVFDGKQEIALCSLKRIKICIDNIKNPFDDCEIDPTKPGGSASPIDNPLP
jgi:hypothetical protein